MKKLFLAALVILSGCAATINQDHPEELPWWWDQFGTRLNIILPADTHRNDAWLICENMGGDTELIYNPYTDRWICENVDF